MIVIDNRVKNYNVEFKTLKAGQAFEYGNLVHIATTPLFDSYGTLMTNAVVLRSGANVKFNGSDIVHTLNCHVVIEKQE